ncbi:MAG: zinc-binding alcohol dehydrogenase [Pseudomonadota bacterium]
MAQRIVFPAPSKVELQRYDPGEIQDYEILIRTEYSLISIGTETTLLHQRYSPDSHFAQRFSFPQLKTGVLAVGKVLQCGSRVNNRKPGDRIYMRQAHGSHQRLPASSTSLVPQTVNPIDACWCGLAKTAFRAAHAADFFKNKRTLIFGAGPLGQMITRWAHYYSCEKIVVNDLSKWRLQWAKDGGAHHSVSGNSVDSLAAINEAFDNNAPNVIIDTTGNPIVLQAALRAAGMFAEIILLGDTGYPERQRLSSDMMTKGLSIQATHDSHDREGWNQARIDALFFDALQSRRFNVDGLISQTFKPQEFAEAYRVADTKRHDVLGLLFDWQ